LKDNEGHPLPRSHGLFKAAMLQEAGGYSEVARNVLGQWQDETGRVYTDYSAVYSVACHYDVFMLLLARAWELFPDQEALFWVELGEAHISHR